MSIPQVDVLLDVELPILDLLQLDLDVGSQRINPLDQVDVHHPIVVHPQGVADGVLGDLEPAVQVATAGRLEENTINNPILAHLFALGKKAL
jgi:hypothetical protein